MPTTSVKCAKWLFKKLSHCYTCTTCVLSHFRMKYGRSFCLKVFQHVRPPLITATCKLLDFLFVNNNCTQYKLNRNISCFFGFQRVKSWMLKQVPFCVCSLMNKMFLTDKHLSFCTNFCTWSSKKKLANSKMFGFKFGIHLSRISC